MQVEFLSKALYWLLNFLNLKKVATSIFSVTDILQWWLSKNNSFERWCLNSVCMVKWIVFFTQKFNFIKWMHFFIRDFRKKMSCFISFFFLCFVFFFFPFGNTKMSLESKSLLWLMCASDKFQPPKCLPKVPICKNVLF